MHTEYSAFAARRRSQSSFTLIGIVCVISIISAGAMFFSFSNANELQSAMEGVTQAYGDAPQNTRANSDPLPARLRVGANTDVVKLRGALRARLDHAGDCSMEAVGIRAIGTALKALAIVGTPSDKYHNKFQKTTTSVSFTPPVAGESGDMPANMTIVKFDVLRGEDGDLEEEEVNDPFRVGRRTAMRALSQRLVEKFENEPDKPVFISVMGPAATSSAVKALCLARKDMIAKEIQGKLAFRARFVKQNELSVVQIKVSYERE